MEEGRTMGILHNLDSADNGAFVLEFNPSVRIGGEISMSENLLSRGRIA